ncbi:hypothetical protein FBZ94_11152 [Bradyrhizobium sacchari]|uniref:Uncharacterized protein n=1 Tax=Bradyrhizobium sacchari TaxID=1399419 RepID=A0A560HVS0_9BRAD|nr:hypothetical protein FBZ94_11152 [Bradyrhizobium sacchari]TWB69070.1 hypothetical protein FBZ95_110192 [Bradyrhizobium sacchari]
MLRNLRIGSFGVAACLTVAMATPVANRPVAIADPSRLAP